MRTVRTVAELRATLGPERAAGRSIALVPTMGALHEGHLSLIRAAWASHDVVVVSVFVNPIQFDDPADLAAYPRDELRDAELAAAAGAGVLFAPRVDELYPDGFATTVRIRGPLTETLEGAHRGPEHFDGVTTVVTKLLLAAQPDAALFGRKDVQQLLVVRRLVRDLGLTARIVACPIVREPDGLALSSRNARLTAAGRDRALGLSRALRAAAVAIESGATGHGAIVERAGLAALRDAGVEPEYFAAVDPATLAPLTALSGEVLVVCAARVDDVRLIDNTTALAPVSAPQPQSQSQSRDAAAATGMPAATAVS